MPDDIAPTLPAAEARTRRHLHDRRHAGHDIDLDDRVVRALAAENLHGEWDARRDSIRWRFRLATTVSRSRRRRDRWTSRG